MKITNRLDQYALFRPLIAYQTFPLASHVQFLEWKALRNGNVESEAEVPRGVDFGGLYRPPLDDENSDNDDNETDEEEAERHAKFRERFGGPLLQPEQDDEEPKRRAWSPQQAQVCGYEESKVVSPPVMPPTEEDKLCAQEHNRLRENDRIWHKFYANRGVLIEAQRQLQQDRQHDRSLVREQARQREEPVTAPLEIDEERVREARLLERATVWRLEDEEMLKYENARVLEREAFDQRWRLENEKFEEDWKRRINALGERELQNLKWVDKVREYNRERELETEELHRRWRCEDENNAEALKLRNAGQEIHIKMIAEQQQQQLALKEAVQRVIPIQLGAGVGAGVGTKEGAKAGAGAGAGAGAAIAPATEKKVGVEADFLA